MYALIMSVSYVWPFVAFSRKLMHSVFALVTLAGESASMYRCRRLEPSAGFLPGGT